METVTTEENVRRLARQTRNIEISDQDSDDWETLKTYFVEHYSPHIISRFYKQPTTGGESKTSGGKNAIPCLFSDIFSNEETKVVCGLVDGTCKIVDLNKLSNNEGIMIDPKNEWKHKGLSCVRCSRVSPFLFFSSSISDGMIRQLDARVDTKKPVQKFPSTEHSVGPSNTSTKATDSKGNVKPILQFDISCNDQLLCGGTELIQEDSYLLFWDIRTSKLFGAYWESHSDDVTAVSFHPNQVHSLTSGSTDGLLNVFNLMESAEEDALQYSFNTDSSVDCINWYCPSTGESNVTCVTHTNEIQVWDAISGDRLTEIKRVKIADAMKRNNPDAVHIANSHIMPDSSCVGLLTCSLSGGNMRLIELNKNLEATPRGLFVDQSAIVQTAEHLSKSHQWVTFDDNGVMKIWNLQNPPTSERKPGRQREISSDERRNRKRFKPSDEDQN